MDRDCTVKATFAIPEQPAAAAGDTLDFTLRPTESPSPSSSHKRFISTTATSSSTLSSPRSSVSLRSRSQTPEVPSSVTLVADMAIARRRLLITKSTILYPPPNELVPFTSCLLAFRVVFYPRTQTRIQDTLISLNFMGVPNMQGNAPIIKVMCPTALTGAETLVKTQSLNTFGLSLGFDPHGSLHLSRQSSLDASYTSHPNVIGSGVESSHAIFTWTEDSVRHAGVESSLDFAMLVQLPLATTMDPTERAFEAELSVEATAAGVSEGFKTLFGSPRVWHLAFDGVTEFGQVLISQSTNRVVSTIRLPH